MRFFSSLMGMQPTSAKGRLSENVRERRTERAERAAEKAAADEAEDLRAGEQRISAYSGMPMAPTELQLEVEAQQRKQRRFRRRKD